MANLEEILTSKEHFILDEIWREIEGYEGYLVSNFGRVKSKRKNKTNFDIIMKMSFDKNGYRRVKLFKNKYPKSIMVHRLVGFSFIDNPENKPQINHINGIKYDNRLENLEWCTNKENVIHAIKTGLIPSSKGKKKRKGIEQKSKWKPVIQKSFTGEIIKKYDTISHALKDGFYMHHITACCQGVKKQYKGFFWEYVNPNQKKFSHKPRIKKLL